MTVWPLPIPAWFWTWAQWRLGRGPYKGHACDLSVRPKDAPTLIPPWAWVRLGILARKPEPVPPAPPVEIAMFDSVTPSAIPADAAAVAGYVNGHWPTYAGLARSFPRAHRLSIAVTASADAECLDVEAGDAVPAQAPAWVRRQLARGVHRPVVYTQLSSASSLQGVLHQAGIARAQYRLWTAHYTRAPHRCSSACGFGFTDVADATQWTERSMGRNLDESLCSPTFFGTDV